VKVTNVAKSLEGTEVTDDFAQKGKVPSLDVVPFAASLFFKQIIIIIIINITELLRAPFHTLQLASLRRLAIQWPQSEIVDSQLELVKCGLKAVVDG
jgi:hypothetical protein